MTVTSPVRGAQGLGRLTEKCHDASTGAEGPGGLAAGVGSKPATLALPTVTFRRAGQQARPVPSDEGGMREAWT